MMISNVIQRDNVILAKKLHPALEEVAKENDKNVRIINLENLQRNNCIDDLRLKRRNSGH